MARTSDNTIRIPTPTDGAVLRVAVDYLGAHPGGQVVVWFGPNVSEAFTAQTFGAFVTAYAYPTERRINRLDMNLPPSGGRIVAFNRGVLQGDRMVPSAFEAEIYFENISNATNPRAVIDAVWANLKAPVALSEGMPSNMVELFARQAQALTEQTLANNADLTATRRKLEAEIAEQKAALEAEHAARARAFEAEAEKTRQALAEQESLLQAKTKEVDDRRARHARREHRQNITDQVKKRLEEPAASSDVRGHRWIIFGVAVIGFVIATASAGLAALELAKDTAATLSLKVGIDGVRFFASSLLATVLLFYLLAHWRRIEREDAQYARDMERFSLDIDRASWVVETVMEFRDEKVPGDVPEAWLHGATANLFNAKPDPREEEPNALEALAELLKKGARVQVGPNGAEIEVSGKTAQKVGKSAN